MIYYCFMAHNLTDQQSKSGANGLPIVLTTIKEQLHWDIKLKNLLKNQL